MQPASQTTNHPPAIMSLCTVKELQTERQLVYKRFGVGFNALCQDLSARSFNEASYTQLCTSITSSFADLSRQIIALEQQMRDGGQTEHAGLVKQLQAAEKDHLALTVELQKWQLKKWGVLSAPLDKDEPPADDPSFEAFVDQKLTGLRQASSDNLIEINDIVSEITVEIADAQES